MPVIKSPARAPKNETIQLRVSQDIKFRLERYAEFIAASPSYVVIEMLETPF
jgi:predicted transcriptional regulator